MSLVDGVEFKEEGLEYGKPAYLKFPEKGMTGWLIRKGWVKSKETAQKIWIGVIIPQGFPRGLPRVLCRKV